MKKILREIRKTQKILFDTIEKLRDDKITPKEARTISKAADEKAKQISKKLDAIAKAKRAAKKKI